jgi:hypothetical protein
LVLTDLKKFAESLRKRQKQKRWPDPSLARYEQTIMVGFFYVRKLIESRKFSRDFADRQVKATAYPTKGKHVHLLNLRRDVDELFDLDVPKQTTMKIEDLANQLIHSYIFYLMMDEQQRLNGIMVASDRIPHGQNIQPTSRRLPESIAGAGFSMMNLRHVRHHQLGTPAGLRDGPRQSGVVAAE